MSIELRINSQCATYIVANKVWRLQMPQRSFRYTLDRFKRLDGAKYTPGQDPVLDRIGFGQGPEAELEWFLRFSNMELRKGSDGEILMLQEECDALLRARHYIDKDHRILTRKQLVDLHAVLKKHLGDLADRGSTLFPPVT